MLKVFIVDDESPARAELRFLLEEFPDVTIVGEAASGEEAIELIPEAEPDAVFLDIHLHDRDGVDVAQDICDIMVTRPIIIFASAYEIHAVRAFEMEAVDYIVKPFGELRLAKTMGRVRKLLSMRTQQQRPSQLIEEKISSLLQHVLVEEQPRRLPVDKNGKILLIDPNEVVYATSGDRYATIYTGEEQYTTSFTLQELESRLCSKRFFRTHRAFIVNLSKTSELVPWFKGSVHLIMQDRLKTEVPVSRNAVKEVKKRLGF